jgi:hypothetical protein
MGSFSAITASLDIFSISVLRELEIAIYERFQAVGCGGRPSWATATGTTTAGTDVQDKNYWRARQDAITTLVNRTNSYTSWRWAVNGSMGGSTYAVGHPASSVSSIHSLSNFHTYWSRYANPSHIWDAVRRPGGSQSSGPMSTSNGSQYGSGGVQYNDLIRGTLLGDLQRACQFLSYPYKAAWIGAVTSDSGGTQGGAFYQYYDGCVSSFNSASPSFDWGNDWSLFDGSQFARCYANEYSGGGGWAFSVAMSGYSLSIGSVYSAVQSRPLVACQAGTYGSYPYTAWRGIGEGGWTVFNGTQSYATHSTLNGFSPAKSFLATTWSTNLPTHFTSTYSLSGRWAYSSPHVLMDYDWAYR